MKTKINRGWIARIITLSVGISMTLTFASSKILGGAGYVVAFVLLALFIFVGILFDVVSVAVAAATPAPFHSMAAHREHGAQEAIRLIRNADKVSSVCGDVVGDISGVICGAMSTLIITRLMTDLSTENILIQLLVTGLVTGMIIGGKALGKTYAMNSSTSVVLRVGKVIYLAARLFGKRRGN